MISRGCNETELRDAYYKDCDHADLYIYDNAEWRTATWAALSSADPPDFGGIVTRDEIWAWKDRTLAWFESHPEMRQHDALYITPEMVSRFIVRAARDVSQMLDVWRAE